MGGDAFVLNQKVLDQYVCNCCAKRDPMLKMKLTPQSWEFWCVQKVMCTKVMHQSDASCSGVPVRQSSQKVGHVQHALRDFAHFEALVHGHFAQFRKGLFFSQSLSFHQQGFRAVD